MCVSEELICSFQTGIKERQEAEQWSKILGYKTKPKKKGGVEQTPAAVMSHTTEPPYTDPHKKSRRQCTYASVCVQKCCICTQGVCMHVCLLCVYSKQITLVHAHVHAYMHTHRGKGVALRAVLFIDVLPQRGSACEQGKKRMERQGKVKGEE